MQDEIQVNLDEIFSLRLQMKSNPPTRRRGGFHPTEGGFHRETISPTRIRVDLVEKVTFELNKKTFK